MQRQQFVLHAAGVINHINHHGVVGQQSRQGGLDCDRLGQVNAFGVFIPGPTRGNEAGQQQEQQQKPRPLAPSAAPPASVIQVIAHPVLVI